MGLRLPKKERRSSHKWRAGMKDIRKELRERLSNAEARRAEQESQLRTTAEEIDILMRLIELEDLKFGAKTESGPPDMPLADAILEMARDDSVSKEELYRRAERRGYFGGTTRGRQSVHATVINLIKSGRLIDVGGGMFATARETAGQSSKTKPAVYVLSDGG